MTQFPSLPLLATNPGHATERTCVPQMKCLGQGFAKVGASQTGTRDRRHYRAALAVGKNWTTSLLFVFGRGERGLKGEGWHLPLPVDRPLLSAISLSAAVSSVFQLLLSDASSCPSCLVSGLARHLVRRRWS